MYAATAFFNFTSVATLADLRTRLERSVGPTGGGIRDVVIRTIRQTSHLIIEWQEEQLFAGKTRNGGFIRPPYKPVTIYIKRRKGQPTDRVTLKDTGAFYTGLYVDIKMQTGVFEINSADDKTPKLVSKYGEKIFGLNKISREGYVWDLRPILKKNVLKFIGL